MMNEIDLKQNSQRGVVDAILVGGLDNRKNKKGKLIDKTTEEQLAIFKQGFSGGNVKVFRWTTPASTVLDYLKSSPKIPIFLFSAGCNLADELIVSKLVDKN